MSGITNKDVSPDSSPVESELPKTQEPKAEATEAAKAPAIPGSRTPETNMLAALHEERKEKMALAEEKRRLEEELTKLKASAPTRPDIEEDIFSDEGKILKEHIGSLESKLKALEEEKELERVYAQHQAIRDAAEEFKSFKVEYPGLPLDKLAKLFLAEKGVKAENRKGLEAPTGGAKTAPQPSMSEDDLARLRTESPRKYLQLVQEGKI